MKRGRPALTMTPRRRQVLEMVIECAEAGEPITYGRIVRECGFSGREDAKRVVRSLGQMLEFLHTPPAPLRRLKYPSCR